MALTCAAATLTYGGLNVDNSVKIYVSIIWPVVLVGALWKLLFAMVDYFEQEATK
jgi:hypothetical protein